MKNIRKKTLLAVVIILGAVGTSVASEAYQGELSDKKLSTVSKKNNSVAVNQAKNDSSYAYDKEYEDLLTHIDASYADDYEIDSGKLNGELTAYESHYDELLAEAEKIIGKEKVNALSKSVDSEPKKKSKNKTKINQLDNTKKSSGSSEASYNKTSDLDAGSEGESIYQGLLDALKTDVKIDGMFKPSENLKNEEDNENNYKYKMDDGFPLKEIMTVGLLQGEQKRFKKCLIMKKYGGGTWRTYCQPLAKPTKCSTREWRDLSTMPIMYC